MSTLYNVYISGLQQQKIEQAESVIEAFSQRFNNRSEKLIDLLKQPRELCFFANISDQQASELQITLTQMGLLCKYRPSDKTLDRPLSLSPLEGDMIQCPFCGQQQKKPDTLNYLRCTACRKKTILFDRRKRTTQQRHIDFNSTATQKKSTLTKPSNSKVSAVEQAKEVTKESRRTRSLYRLILGVTILSLTAILFIALWQSFSTPSHSVIASHMVQAAAPPLTISTVSAQYIADNHKADLLQQLTEPTVNLPIQLQDIVELNHIDVDPLHLVIDDLNLTDLASLKQQALPHLSDITESLTAQSLDTMVTELSTLDSQTIENIVSQYTKPITVTADQLPQYYQQWDTLIAIASQQSSNTLNPIISAKQLSNQLLQQSSLIKPYLGKDANDLFKMIYAMEQQNQKVTAVNTQLKTNTLKSTRYSPATVAADVMAEPKIISRTLPTLLTLGLGLNLNPSEQQLFPFIFKLGLENHQ